MAIDWLALQRTARREFDTRLAQVTDWSAPTPDTEWDVATLVRHVVDEQRWVMPLVSGRTLEEAEASLEPLGDDLAAEWAR
ncbi:maleylpyruvate isomerase N-terminal domain-containing protein, partial [Rhodococcus chondri]